MSGKICGIRLYRFLIITFSSILKLIAEGIFRYFSDKSVFDDKLKVSCPAGVDNY